MSQAIYRTIAIVVILCCSVAAYSQRFYVNALWNPNQSANQTYEFTVGQCDIPKDSLDMTIYTCKAKLNPVPFYSDSIFTDIAIDVSQNIWYLMLNGGLYTRKLDDTTSCRYVGSFLDTPATFGGLVADRNGTIYAAGNRYDHSVLYKYDPVTGFKYLGMLPKRVECSGDLFFYKRRLFMTCIDYRADSFFLYEIALADPAQSCYYMPLPGITHPFAAFSYEDGNKHRVFISSTDTFNYSTSQLFEIDIENKKVLGSICKYPLQVRGAAAYYDATGDTTHCPIVPNSISETKNHSDYITIYNPSTQTIRINTNIKQQDIRTIDLYDLYGKKLRQFNSKDYPDNLRIADLPDGMYILYIAAKDGRQWKEKVVKGGG